MEDKCEDNSPGTSNVLPKVSEIVVMDSELQVNANSDVEKSSGPSGTESLSGISQGLSLTISGFTCSFCHRCSLTASCCEGKKNVILNTAKQHYQH